MKTPTIETERIVIRPLKISDAKAIYNHWAKDPDVLKYLRWNAHQSIDVTIEWLKYEEQSGIEDDNSYQWAFEGKESHEVFGSGSLSYNKERRMFEISYALMKKQWGKGLATEAVKAIVHFAINELNQTELFATYAKDNFASGRVLEKTGFVCRNHGKYASFDGERIFESKEMFFTTDTAV
ncbi:MAG: GNAT family N-acetyltransferase [Oscillospiraceae bacterium]|nr:GNAT family N-acetyltransferase [Oscillospiraceae bacterium]